MTHEFSEASDRAKAGLSETILQTCEEYPEITQSLLSQVTLVSQSQISRYISGDQPMPVTWVMALKDDDRTRPLAVAIMRYMAGFSIEIAEKPRGVMDDEPVSHSLIEMDLAKARLIQAIGRKAPAAAMKALDDLAKMIWTLRVKVAGGNLRKVK